MAARMLARVDLMSAARVWTVAPRSATVALSWARSLAASCCASSCATPVTYTGSSECDSFSDSDISRYVAGTNRVLLRMTLTPGSKKKNFNPG